MNFRRLSYNMRKDGKQIWHFPSRIVNKITKNIEIVTNNWHCHIKRSEIFLHKYREMNLNIGNECEWKGNENFCEVYLTELRMKIERQTTVQECRLCTKLGNTRPDVVQMLVLVCIKRWNILHFSTIFSLSSNLLIAFFLKWIAVVTILCKLILLSLFLSSLGLFEKAGV